jgi:hypothetical protein
MFGVLRTFYLSLHEIAKQLKFNTMKKSIKVLGAVFGDSFGGLL